MAFLKGDIRILYIKDGSTYLPIGCLTSNPLSEETEMLQVATSTAGGWGTSIPTNQSFSIEFSGLQMLTTGAGDTTKLSYDTIRTKKRARTRAAPQASARKAPTAMNFRSRSGLVFCANRTRIEAKNPIRKKRTKKVVTLTKKA